MNVSILKQIEEKIKLAPSNRYWYEIRANYWAQQKHWQNAANSFKDYIEQCPNDAEGYFNCGYYLKKSGQYNEAKAHYEKSLRLNISGSEEVYLNLAALYSEAFNDYQNAIAMLKKALDINPNYVSAIYNLANLYEDMGDVEQALTLFLEVESKDPLFFDATARILHLRKNNESDTPRMERLLQTIKAHPSIHDEQKINGLYAAGKAFDDIKQYDKAFSCFQQANQLNSKYVPPYDKKDTEQRVEHIINSSQSIESASIEGVATPHLFICGMFRSGSTLVEQILAAHSQITAGGEQEFFPRLINSSFNDFPYGEQSVDYEAVKSGYKNRLQEQFGRANIVTDKRNDNLNYVGFIKRCLPDAKFIFTNRRMEDNCLSVYFLRLAPSLNYATNLSNIRHFYLQQAKLQEHWKALYPNDVFTIDYERLVESPQSEIESLLHFLGLEWQESCLNFHQAKSTVKTASAWQVRQPLYKSSSGRFKNYQQYIPSFDDD